MDQERHKRLYHLHSASGIWLGFFLYFIAITGCFALFYTEMQTWDDPAKRVAPAGEVVNIDASFKAWLDDMSANAPITFARIDMPTETKPYYYAFANTQLTGEPVVPHEIRWSAATGEILEARGKGAVDWLYGIHRDLNWPESLGGRRIGRALAGLAGVVLLMSIISGILIHTKIFQEMFSLRFYRSVRLKWQDLHKVIGVWGIPAFGMFALTGAFLGIITLLAPATAFLTLKGDQEALIEAVVGVPTAPAGVSAHTLLPSEVSALPRPDGVLGAPQMLVYRNWGDANAEVDVLFAADTELTVYETYTRNAVTGGPLPRTGTNDLDNPPVAVVASYSALHYGTYGGLALKFLYLAMGLSLAVMTGLGLMMWVERRLHGSAGSKSKRYYQRFSHMVTGAVMGVPLASVMTLHIDRFYSGVETARFGTVGWVYFGTAVATILYALLRRQDYSTVRESMMATGGLFLVLPFSNGLTTGGGLITLLGAEHKAAGLVDLALLTIGGLLLAVAWQLPSERHKKACPKDQETVAAKVSLRPSNVAAE